MVMKRIVKEGVTNVTKKLSKKKKPPTQAQKDKKAAELKEQRRQNKEVAAEAKKNPPVNPETSKMFARQFNVPTPGVKSADGSVAKYMRQVEAGASGKVNAGKDRPAFLPTPTQMDKRIAKLERDDRAGKLSDQDKADLKALKRFRNKKDAEAANRQAGRTATGRQNQSMAQKKRREAEREAKKGDGFDQSTGEITDAKKFFGLTANRRRDLIKSGLIRGAFSQKRAAELLSLQGMPDKGPKIKSSNLPSKHSRGGSVGQANSRFGSRDYRKGGMVFSTKKKK